MYAFDITLFLYCIPDFCFTFSGSSGMGFNLQPANMQIIDLKLAWRALHFIFYFQRACGAHIKNHHSSNFLYWSLIRKYVKQFSCSLNLFHLWEELSCTMVSLPATMFVCLVWKCVSMTTPGSKPCRIRRRKKTFLPSMWVKRVCNLRQCILKWVL